VSRLPLSAQGIRSHSSAEHQISLAQDTNNKTIMLFFTLNITLISFYGIFFNLLLVCVYFSWCDKKKKRLYTRSVRKHASHCWLEILFAHPLLHTNPRHL